MLRSRLFKFMLLAGILGIMVGGLPLAAQAQNGQIEGNIQDSQSGEDLPGASVLIQGTNKGAAADIDGDYLIRSVPAGEHVLVVTYVGYQRIERAVTVEAGETLEMDFEMTPRGVTGEEVVIQAQAQGQNQAINQQLSSSTISDVVSEARIKEMPDVNAAESVGRLPGVSLERSGGEATKVAIRGLSPKYNSVTVNGVSMPATGGTDRSVDLSIISSNMLDGIEVSKSVTPDMQADALGGSVDLRLREAPDTLSVEGSAQLGYNGLRENTGNYKLNLSASDRFFNDKLGVIANFNADDYNRSADIFNTNYYETTEEGTNATIIQISNVNLQEQQMRRSRLGGSMVMDYQIPDGKITFNAFYNRSNRNRTDFINNYDVRYNRHYHHLNDTPEDINTIFNSALGFEKSFDFMEIDASVARSSTVGDIPTQYQFTFAQESNAYNFGGVSLSELEPTDVPNIENYDSTRTGLADLYKRSIDRHEYVTSSKLNIKFPFSLGLNANGFFKFGGRVGWLDRANDVEQYGRNGLHYGGGATVFESMGEVAPESFTFDGLPLGDIHTDQYPMFPLFLVSDDYFYPDYMDGDYGNYPFGPRPNLSTLKDLYGYLDESGESLRYTIPSLGEDYKGIERNQAAYAMAEFNWGIFSLMGGVRYERTFTEYEGRRFRETTPNNQQGPPADLEKLEIERDNEFILPMVHLRVEPVDWMKIRLARTETLTRPDYIHYAPITRINSYQTYGRAANSQLDPSQAVNYDASVSFRQNHLGFFTANVFYKDITDLIFQTSYRLRGDIEPLPGMNIPDNWYAQTSPTFDTYVNNPFETTYKGYELSWQTHFWYLPSVLSGLVLNANFSRIYSETRKRLFELEVTGYTDGFPAQRIWGVKDTSRTARMPDQPKYLANVTLGYDYKGFSARLSYRYQSNKVAYIDRLPVLDQFTGTYQRWDLALKQQVNNKLNLFANLNNINRRKDRAFQGSELVNPTYIEHYGFTMDVGVRYQF